MYAGSKDYFNIYKSNLNTHWLEYGVISPDFRNLYKSLGLTQMSS